ncbi:MAG: VWA domain-containing protein [Bacteroidetes bacterium]|nr:VWA domain-containing protein [Bacteroidota bacterium]
MIQFAHPEHLQYLFLLPLIALVLWGAWYLRNRSVRRYGLRSTVLRMVPARSRVKYWLRGSILLLAFASLIVAYANPKVGTKFEEVTRSGIDLIVAIDVSSSMLAEDIQPNRISAAKKELQNLINNLKGDRIGIIVFSGEAYTQLPLTSDYNAALMLTDVITTGIAPRPGTAIGSAIELARESFKKEEGKYKAMVIITDGENHEDDPVAVAKEAAPEGIVIHTIGMGSLEGAPIPVGSGDRRQGFKKDQDGNLVLTRLDDETLREIARITGGSFTQALSGRDNLATVFEQIERMEKKEFGTKQFTDFEDRFQYLLFLGLLLLVTELLISETRNRFLSRFSIFAPNEEKEGDER